MNHKKILIICIALAIFIAGSMWIKDNAATGGNLASSGVNVAGEVCPTGQAKSIENHGITWYFQDCEQYGTYANGDYWVVGPVSITSITPLSGTRMETMSNGKPYERIINGTVVNPAVGVSSDPQTQNGYDNAIGMNGILDYGSASYWDGYNKAPSRNGGQSLVAQPGTTVLSSISTNSLPQDTSYPQIARIVSLTVVSTAPRAGSFRPPMIGSDKTSKWNKDQLNYSILKSLEPVAGTPSLDSVEAEFAIPWTTLHTGNWIQGMTPEQQPHYGRDQAHKISKALFSLNLNYTSGPGGKKEKLYIALVQYGIDVYGFLEAGGVYRGAGGLNHGHKAPLVLAAVALNDPALKAWADGSRRVNLPERNIPVRPFIEDSQLWKVNSSDIGRVLYNGDGRYRAPYIAADVGIPEWGSEHEIDQLFDGRNWNVYYRDIYISANVGNALGIKLITGGEAAWNNPTFFNYIDRAWAIEGAGGYGNQTSAYNPIPVFDFNMMKAYRNGGTSIPPSTTSTLTIAKSGNGTGTVTGVGISCGSDCSETYSNNTVVTLTAAPIAPATFSGWSGGDCSGTGSCIVTMDGTKTVTATFQSSSGAYSDVTSSIQIQSIIQIGQTYPVTLEYSANGDKDVIVQLKKGNSTIYKTIRSQLSTGQNLTKIINLEVPKDANVSTTEDLNVIAYMVPRDMPQNEQNSWNFRTATPAQTVVRATIPTAEICRPWN